MTADDLLHAANADEDLLISDKTCKDHLQTTEVYFLGAYKIVFEGISGLLWVTVVFRGFRRVLVGLSERPQKTAKDCLRPPKTSKDCQRLPMTTNDRR